MVDKVVLEVKNICKWYEKLCALHEVSLKLREGEVLGLIGDNGAGKSTLIKIISGTVSYDKGDIYWEGKKIENYSIKKARSLGIETAFQDESLIDCFDVSQNLFLARGITKPFLGVFKRLDYKKMHEESRKVMNRLRLEGIPPTQEVRFCSGGEKQGVVVSRTMYFKSKLVILDEPTKALSVATDRQVQEFVKQLKREKIACIFITHNLYHVYSVADQFVVLRKGIKTLEKEKKNTTISELENAIIGIGVET